MDRILYIIIQLAVMILAAPLVNGIIRKIKAFSQKRRGAPLFQMYFDIFKLLRKRAVVSDVTSWIFKAAPYVVFSTAAAAAVLTPVTTKLSPVGFSGDIILLVYILALGRFFMTLSGLDAGSAFGGMGSSRETMVSALIEPSILISAFTIGLAAKSTSIPEMMTAMQAAGAPLLNPAFILVFLAMLVIIIAETARIPVDDPATHLELTMVHEAMILEYSGRHLALMEFGAAIKQLIFVTLLVNLLLPTDQLIGFAGAGAVAVAIAIYLVKVVFVSALIALIEVGTVKLRLFSVPNLAALAFILALLGFLQYFVFGR